MATTGFKYRTAEVDVLLDGSTATTPPIGFYENHTGGGTANARDNFSPSIIEVTCITGKFLARFQKKVGSTNNNQIVADHNLVAGQTATEFAEFVDLIPPRGTPAGTKQIGKVRLRAV